MDDSRKNIKKELDEKLVALQIAVIDQLLIKVADGTNLRDAIECLKMNKRTVLEGEVLGGDKDMRGYLDDLLDNMDITKRKRS
jgi:hypothetical protein